MEQTLITVGSFLFCVFLWEHIARKNSVSFRPSCILNFVADQFVAVFYWIGNKFAWLSSFYDWIEFGELIQTAKILWRAVWLLVTTPFELCKGYYDYLKTLSYPVLGVLGTLTLLVTPVLIYGPPSFLSESLIRIQMNEHVVQIGMVALSGTAFACVVFVLSSLHIDIDGKYPIPPPVKPKRSRQASTATPSTPRGPATGRALFDLLQEQDYGQ